MADDEIGQNQSKKEPAIRTMKSDMAEYLKKVKPSLVSLLTKQSQADARRGVFSSEKKLPAKTLLILLAVAAILGGAFIAYLYLRLKTPPPPSGEPQLPASSIFFESSDEVTINDDQRSLADALAQIGEKQQSTGTFRRIIIRVKTGVETAPIIEAPKFFQVLSGKTPHSLAPALGGPPQFFIYRQNSGPRFGIILETTNPQAALAAFKLWEPAMQSDFSPIFLGHPPPSSFDAYRDITYKNIDFRYLKMDPINDYGFGYLYFPARNLIIISTSEEALRLTINRLFENR